MGITLDCLSGIASSSLAGVAISYAPRRGLWEAYWSHPPSATLCNENCGFESLGGLQVWAVLVVVLLKPTQEVMQPGIIPQTVHQINV